MVLLLAGVLGWLFRGGFPAGHVVFSNDGPLGAAMARWYHMPELLAGSWQDLNTIGTSGGQAPPSITYGLLWLLGPVGFAKLYPPLVLLILGLGAWTCFRQLGLAPFACILGGLAAALVSTFFTAVAWGVGSQAICFGLAFLAVGLLARPTGRGQWARTALAGLAVGMGVMEGADIGAFFSIMVAAFLAHLSVVVNPRTGANGVRGLGRLVMVVACAGLIAVSTV
jgi:hypothetical protein